MTETSLFVWRDADGVRHFGDQEGWQAEQQRWEKVAMYYGKASIAQLAKAIARCGDGPVRTTVERYKRDDGERAKV